MGQGDPISGTGDELSRIRHLAVQLNENSSKLKKSGRWTHGQISDHVKMHKLFEKAIDDLKTEQTGKKIPSDLDITHILDESNKLIKLFQTSLDQGYQSGGSSPKLPESPVSPGIKANLDDSHKESTEIYGIAIDEIEEVLRSLPNMTEKQIPKDAIERAFQKEAAQQSSFIIDLEEILTHVGLNIKEISNLDLKVLVSCLIVNRNIDRTFTKEKATIFETLLPYVFEKFKSEKSYSSKISKFQQEVLKTSLISEETASTIDEKSGLSIRDMMFLYSKMQDKESIFSKELDVKINSLLTDRFSQICLHIKALKSPETQLEKIEKSITDAMGILNCLSKNLPVNENTEDVWMDLHQSFHEVLSIKFESSQLVQDLIGKVFQQFETFIEDGILTYLLLNGGGSPEHVAQRIYGRTEGELEQIKTRNRKAVAKKILEFAKDIRNGTPLTVEMLSELHRVNNKSIVPKIASQFRSDTVKFGKRVGLLPEDIKRSLEDIFKRADQMLKRDEGWGIVSYFTLSIEIAKLHNEILDIHPFIDRNGSTALLFVELMMAVKKGYIPSSERNIHYYRNLSTILNNSILGTAIVATEHYKIAYVPGHYESRALKLTEEKKARYRSLLTEPSF